MADATAPTDEEAIDSRVRAALIKSRTPGFHFTGHLLAASNARVTAQDSLVVLEGGAHCRDDDGAIETAAICVLADLALETCLRAVYGYGKRLATVGLHLQFTGATARTAMQATARFRGLHQNGARPQAITSLTINGDGEDLCIGSGTFMVLDPPKGALSSGPTTEADPTPTLTPDERAVLRRARTDGSALCRLWGVRTTRTATGASGRLPNGVAVANRVGGVHGGVLVAFAQAVARAAMPQDWTVSSITVSFVGPGAGPVLHARARIVHQGRATAVIQVAVLGPERRRILEGFALYSATDSRAPA